MAGDSRSIQTETDADKALRRVRVDARDGGVAPEGYVAPGGEVVAVTGDDEAPYTRVIGTDVRPDQRGTLSTYSSLALENQVVIKAAAGRLYASRVLVAAALGADHWLLYFDVATPATPLILGAVPVWRVVLPTGALESADELPNGMFFSNSIVVALSTTPLTLTLPLVASGIFQIGFS